MWSREAWDPQTALGPSQAWDCPQAQGHVGLDLQTVLPAFPPEDMASLRTDGVQAPPTWCVPQGQPRPRTSPTPLSWMRSLGGGSGGLGGAVGGVVQVAIPGSQGTAGPGGGRGSSRCGPRSAASGSGSRRSSSPAGRSSTWTGSSPPLQGSGQVRAGQAPPPPQPPWQPRDPPWGSGDPSRSRSRKSAVWKVLHLEMSMALAEAAAWSRGSAVHSWKRASTGRVRLDP